MSYYQVQYKKNAHGYKIQIFYFLFRFLFLNIFSVFFIREHKEFFPYHFKSFHPLHIFFSCQLQLFIFILIFFYKN